ncbi:class C beta-lactamase-related serine hydrolase [Albitalea terrae]|uniref:Class C beta-lactamase-related serine hydrolase n=2 Tax=Piscinibacter terrae TaxID=2496871 RepID=A0A3N7HLY6_9BURK|nr:class C beta-lactamase-related serine hydrolase [Albitalea terrae]
MVGAATASPDEDLLGKQQGYPRAPRLSSIHDPAYIVGSFSGMDRITSHCELAPAEQPSSLRASATQAAVRYRFGGREHTLADYMEHQRATAVLIVKDGEIIAERYGYGRTAAMRMLSNSMAKTLVALAVGQALEDGSIKSLQDTADQYVPGLTGTLYGGTRLVDLLRMASGAKYVEDYTDTDDRKRFLVTAATRGVLAAAAQVKERSDPPGSRFNYAGAQTEVLGLVLRAATHRSLCSFIDETIWKPMGAQSKATFLVRASDDSEIAQGGFNATARDYARLGWMLANDGMAQDRQVISRDYLLDMTDPARQPEDFRPGRMDYHGRTYYGYGFQTWLLPGKTRQFALLGVYGQAIYVDPQLKLVMVHLAVGKDASGDASGAHLGAERDALWRGLVAGMAR